MYIDVYIYNACADIDLYIWKYLAHKGWSETGCTAYSPRCSSLRSRFTLKFAILRTYILYIEREIERGGGGRENFGFRVRVNPSPLDPYLHSTAVSSQPFFGLTNYIYIYIERERGREGETARLTAGSFSARHWLHSVELRVNPAILRTGVV